MLAATAAIRDREAAILFNFYALDILRKSPYITFKVAVLTNPSRSTGALIVGTAPGANMRLFP